MSLVSNELKNLLCVQSSMNNASNNQGKILLQQKLVYFIAYLIHFLPQGAGN